MDGGIGLGHSDEGNVSALFKVQVQVSINTYYNMLDARKDYDTNLTTPF